MEYWHIFIIGCIAGIGSIFLFFKKKGDTLPEPLKNCVWHTKVLKLDRVYDGDTFFAHVKGHSPIDKKPVGIRVRGIDAPEMKDSRPAVKKKALKAKELAETELKNAKTIHLYNVSMKDKYGRMLATVFCDRKDLAKMLFEKRLGKKYDGGTKQQW